MDLSTYLTPTQAADALDISTTRLRQLCQAGRLGHVSTPHGRLFDPEVIQEFRQTFRRRRHNASVPRTRANS